jgi:hypothetical protein
MAAIAESLHDCINDMPQSEEAADLRRELAKALPAQACSALFSLFSLLSSLFSLLSSLFSLFALLSLSLARALSQSLFSSLSSLFYRLPPILALSSRAYVS